MPVQKCHMCKNLIPNKQWGSPRCKRLGCAIEYPEIHADCDFYDHDPDAKPIELKKWVVK